jgi:hypothetical protein
MKLLLKIPKTKLQQLSLLFPILTASCFLSAAPQTEENKEKSGKKNIYDGVFEDESSVWESDPIEIECARIQILDKVSGKVYRETVVVNCPKKFGTVELKLKRCFKNGPEDDKEVSALIEISEQGKVIFVNWLFASAPSVNLFAHPVYDVRVEF